VVPEGQVQAGERNQNLYGLGGDVYGEKHGTVKSLKFKKEEREDEEDYIAFS